MMSIHRWRAVPVLLLLLLPAPIMGDSSLGRPSIGEWLQATGRARTGSQTSWRVRGGAETRFGRWDPSYPAIALALPPDVLSRRYGCAGECNSHLAAEFSGTVQAIVVAALNHPSNPLGWTGGPVRNLAPIEQLDLSYLSGGSRIALGHVLALEAVARVPELGPVPLGGSASPPKPSPEPAPEPRPCPPTPACPTCPPAPTCRVFLKVEIPADMLDTAQLMPAWPAPWRRHQRARLQALADWIEGLEVYRLAPGVGPGEAETLPAGPFVPGLPSTGGIALAVGEDEP